MQRRTRITTLALGLAVTLGACRDAPTEVQTGPFTESALARGGSRGGGDGLPANATDLGRFLFQDENLSVNQNQSCETCHHPDEGFASAIDPGFDIVGSVVEGSVPGEFGNRKPPTSAYATSTPHFSEGGKVSGGAFWDGRATGEALGNPAADQALGPFLNPAEQAMPDEACVVWRVHESTYAGDFATVWPDIDLSAVEFPDDVGQVCTTPVPQSGEYVTLTAGDRRIVDAAYDAIALSIAAFEESLNVFDSKRDLGRLDELELAGEKVFTSKGKCGQCHVYKGSKPLYTDFEFHNLGVPRNPANPFDFEEGYDPGLGGFTGDPTHLGKFRTPTLRNVGLGSNRTYMHNGALVSLRQVVQFYSTRDVLPTCTDPVVLADPSTWGPDGEGCWPPPEYPENLDTQNMGNLGLTDDEVDALVAFMRALTDVGLLN